jgi:hypothetical protein
MEWQHGLGPSIARAVLAIGVWSALHARPAGAAIIVDVNSLHGTATPDEIVLAAGTYVVTPVGIADGGAYDGWNPWGSTTCAAPGGCLLTVPTTVMGWKNAYDVISDDIVSVSVGGTPLVPVAVEPGGLDQIRNFFLSSASVTRYHVDDQKAYPSALLALANPQASVFTLNSSGPVGFSVQRPLPERQRGRHLAARRDRPRACDEHCDRHGPGADRVGAAEQSCDHEIGAVPAETH